MHISTHSRSMLARRVEFNAYRAARLFSSTTCSQRKHMVDHYATLSVPRTATKAQIKTRYYQLSKQHHPDVTKDTASQTKFHAVSEAYAILGDDRKRREYDRTLGSSFQSHYEAGQHPQATTTRTSQHGFKHAWHTHPRNRTRDPMGTHPNAARHDYLNQRGASNVNDGSRADPFVNPFVQRATGHRRTEPGAGGGAQTNKTSPNLRHGGFQSAGSAPPRDGDGKRTSAADGRPTRDEAAAESGMMRALGASGLVGVIMLVSAIIGQSNAKRTS